MMSFQNSYLLISLLVSLLLGTAWSSQRAEDVINSVEEDGYFRREHSLVQPYHGIIIVLLLILSLFSCWEDVHF